MNKRIAVLTFDVDFTDYLSGAGQDELETVFPLIRDILLQFPEIRTTWFIRIDSQVEAIYGSALYAFEQHAEKINWLQQHGHEIGWHHHAYRQTADGWEQETDETTISTNLLLYGSLARAQNIRTARMGWGQHTNNTLQVIASLGFETDSSAMPRPKYSWDNLQRDWSRTGQAPYFPAVQDYQVAGTPALPLLEIPMSTVPLPLPADTEPGVIRYINAAYHTPMFEKAVADFTESIMVLITHPYELLHRSGAVHNLLAFDADVFRANLRTLSEKGFLFQTVSSIAHE